MRRGEEINRNQEAKVSTSTQELGNEKKAKSRSSRGRKTKRQLELMELNCQKRHEPSASLYDSMDHIVCVFCSFDSENKTGREKRTEILSPTVWGAHRLGGGLCSLHRLGTSGSRILGNPLSIWSGEGRENNRSGSGCRHYPAGAGVEVGGPGPCAIGHPA